MRALRSDLRARVRMVHGRKSDFFTNRSCGIWEGVPRTSAYVTASQVEVLVGCGTSAATLPVERVESWNGSRKCPALGAGSYRPAGGVAPSGVATNELNVPGAFTHAEQRFLR